MKLKQFVHSMPIFMKMLSQLIDNRSFLVLADSQKNVHFSSNPTFMPELQVGNKIKDNSFFSSVIENLVNCQDHYWVQKINSLDDLSRPVENGQIFAFILQEGEAVEGYLLLIVFHELGQKYHQIFKILGDMNQEVELESALNILTHRSIALFDADMVGIWLWQEGNFNALSLSSQTPEQEHFLLKAFFPNAPSLVNALFTVVKQDNHKFLIEMVDNGSAPDGSNDEMFFTLWHDPLNRFDITQITCIPLMHFGQLLGVYTIFSKRKFIMDDFIWLEHFMPLISNFVYEQQMRIASFEREQALTLLLRGTEILVQVESEEQLLREAGEMAMEILYLEAGVFLLKNVNNQWQIKAPFGRFKQMDAPLETWMKSYIEQNGGGDYHPRTSSTSIDIDISAWAEDWIYNWKKIFIQPLRVHSGVIGELWLVNSNSKDLEERQETLAAFVRVLGVALETIWQRQELERLALTDRLTGIYNRQGFEQRMREVMESVIRRDSSLLFLILDLDHFKELNDTKGHPAGDAALKKIAYNLRASVRSYDLVARTGGDEFVVVLTDLQNNDEGIKIVNRLKEHIQLEEEGLGATIGMAEFPGEAQDYESLYRLADQRLYQGKYLGRGKVVFS